MKNEIGSPISFFYYKEKRKTEIKLEFHFPMQSKIGWHQGTRISNDYFIPTVNERKCAA